MTSGGYLTVKTKMTMATMMTLWCWSPQKFITCCKMWPAVQDGWFHHVRRHLSLDVDSFWSRLKNSHQCTRLCQRSNQKGAAKYWERGKIKPLHLENKTTAMVMLVGVNCINSHPFALGILSEGKQRNITLTDELYTLSANSASFQVSAHTSDNNDKFQPF